MNTALAQRQRVLRVRQADKDYLEIIARIEGDVTVPKVTQAFNAQTKRKLKSEAIYMRMVKLYKLGLLRRVGNTEPRRKLGNQFMCYQLTEDGRAELA